MSATRVVLLASGLAALSGCSADNSGMSATAPGQVAGQGAVVTASGNGNAPMIIVPMSSVTTGAKNTPQTAALPPNTPQNNGAPANAPPGVPATGVPVSGAPGKPAAPGGAPGVPPAQPPQGGPGVPAMQPPIGQMQPMAATPSDPNAKKPPPEKLPQVKGTCPELSSGSVMVAGSTVVIWAGTKPGPAYFYFHGTGTSPQEVDQGFPGATAGVRTNGGLVASWDGSNSQGTNTGTIWYTGDLDAMDQLVACGVQKGIIDTARIHVAGYSAGGLETGAAIFSRSNYVASGIVYSGGKPFGAGNLQDPSNVPAVLGAHGAQGQDALGLDFHDGTIALENEVVALGGFAMDCDDNMDHIGGWFTRAGVGGKAMQFLADHPYNTKPSPYAAALPAGFPAYCKVAGR